MNLAMPLQKYAVLTVRSSCPSKSADKAMVSGEIGFAAELGSVDWANAGPDEHNPMDSNRAERRNATGSLKRSRRFLSLAYLDMAANRQRRALRHKSRRRKRAILCTSARAVRNSTASSW